MRDATSRDATSRKGGAGRINPDATAFDTSVLCRPFDRRFVMGFQVIASKNRNSIRREQTNHWVRQSMGINGDLVREADDVVGGELLTRGHEQGPLALEAALHASLPAREVSPKREQEIVETFLEHMQAGSFPDCGSSALDVWHGDKGAEMARTARASLVPSPARDTEGRRVKSVREAAAKAGWSPAP